MQESEDRKSEPPEENPEGRGLGLNGNGTIHFNERQNQDVGYLHSSDDTGNEISLVTDSKKENSKSSESPIENPGSKKFTLNRNNTTSLNEGQNQNSKHNETTPEDNAGDFKPKENYKRSKPKTAIILITVLIGVRQGFLPFSPWLFYGWPAYR